MSVKEDRVVESLLFSAGKPLSVEEIQETTGLLPKHVTDAIDISCSPITSTGKMTPP